jgi:hypothetical protein
VKISRLVCPESSGSTGNLNGFYDPNTHLMIFIEHPDATSTQAHAQEVLTHGGVQNYQHGPNEETAFHELGHGIDKRVFKDFSHSKEFDVAFREGRDALTPSEREKIDYFCNPSKNAPKGHEYDVAKEELSAQIFAAMHTPVYRRDERDSFLLEHFKKVVQLMRDDKHQLLES